MTAKKTNKPIRFEGEYNLFYKIVMLVKTNPIPVVLTILLTFMVGAMYLQFQFFQAQINKTSTNTQVIKEAVAPDETGAVERKLETDKKVDFILEQIRIKYNADRAKLFQYHNSITSVGGVKFLYISATNEVDKAGVSKEYANLQRLPSSLFNPTIQRYLDSSPVVCVTRTGLAGDVGQQYFDNQGIASSCNYPVIIDNNIVGVVTLNFNSERKDLKESDLKQDLSFTAVRISDVLRP